MGRPLGVDVDLRCEHQLGRDLFGGEFLQPLHFCLSMIWSDPKGREAQTGSHPRIKSEGKLFGIIL